MKTQKLKNMTFLSQIHKFDEQVAELVEQVTRLYEQIAELGEEKMALSLEIEYRQMALEAN